jgi:hypothetical protein
MELSETLGSLVREHPVITTWWFWLLLSAIEEIGNIRK